MLELAAIPIMVAPGAIPVPETDIPTTRPLVFAMVTVGELRTVVPV